jgi:hypothetical protein
MAMTHDDGHENEPLLDGLDPADLDGHTIEELSDYLDAGREPRDEDIENSPGARIALDALARLRDETWAMLEAEATADPTRDTGWMAGVLANISRESRAGRDIPISHPDPAVHLSVTEGSVRGLIRAVGDRSGDAIIGRVLLDGDVTVPGESITVTITASARYGANLGALAASMRESIAAELRLHTELELAAVNVTITDVHTHVTQTSGGRS